MWPFGGPRNAPSFFEAQYNCSSTAVAGKDIDEGDKIFLPPSALDKLARMNVEYPMLFEITNNVVGKKSHCGVLEFSAEEGWCYMPFGMMQNLCMEEGGLLTVRNVSLAKATFIKLRAQSVDFLEVSNHRALLEVSLRKFTCLTVGDTICIPYSNRKFYLDIREVEPNGCASIIETDCNVDFEEPLGYKESKYGQFERDKEARDAAAALSKASSTAGSKASSTNSLSESDSSKERVLQKARVVSEEEAAAQASAFKAFSGNAKRIDGKIPTSSSSTSNADGIASSQSSSSSSSSTAGGAAPPTSVFQAKSDRAKYFEEKFANSAPANANGSSKDTPITIDASTPPVVAYQSRIGDKYSKKKVSVSAFTGTANKM